MWAGSAYYQLDFIFHGVLNISSKVYTITVISSWFQDTIVETYLSKCVKRYAPHGAIGTGPSMKVNNVDISVVIFIFFCSMRIVMNNTRKCYIYWFQCAPCISRNSGDEVPLVYSLLFLLFLLILITLSFLVVGAWRKAAYLKVFFLHILNVFSAYSVLATTINHIKIDTKYRRIFFYNYIFLVPDNTMRTAAQRYIANATWKSKVSREARKMRCSRCILWITRSSCWKLNRYVVKMLFSLSTISLQTILILFFKVVLYSVSVNELLNEFLNSFSSKESRKRGVIISLQFTTRQISALR